VGGPIPPPSPATGATRAVVSGLQVAAAERHASTVAGARVSHSVPHPPRQLPVERVRTAVPVHCPLASSNCQCRGQTPRTKMAQQLTTPARTALAPTKRAQRIDLRRTVVVKPPLLQAGLCSSWAVASTNSSITPTLTTPGVGAEAVVGVAPVRVAVVAELGPALGTLRPIFFLWRRRTSTSYADAAPQVLFGRY